ncbi:MAG: DUF1330 domain-containing protein [Rhodospirillales bacterium]|nr:DUF1330 domain-containing protein [Rhodospirillales bacterium]QQS14344.1 MAG: DUF1330 domain-containing protein [Rhodospirillales bacterium]
MAAYLIVEIDTKDPDLMAEYRKHTPGLIARFGGRFIVRGGETETVEGGWAPPRLVVIEFPDMATARRFYHSEEYKPVLAMRLKAGNCRAVIADGAPPA